jgi:hypothetical protein
MNMTLKHLVALALALTVGAIGSAAAQPSVGVTIGINQPGVYGQIHIGNLPPPALVAPHPLHARRGRTAAPPVYVYAPDAQRRDWRRYCGRYDACDRPVYFVREDWVRARYEREHPGWDRGQGRGHARGHEHSRGQSPGHRRQDERGNHGHGN